MSESNPIRGEIVQRLSDSLSLDRETVEDLLEVPPSPDMGDYALPCFALAKELKRAPAQIAAELAAGFPTSPRITKAAASGPYLNFFVSREIMASEVLLRVRRSAEGYGRSDVGTGKTVVLDYSSPNIAKHLGVHHLRSAIIGRSLHRIFEALGYRCVGINHLGDWGTSFGKLVAAFERYEDLDAQSATVSDLQDAYVRYNLEAEKEPELEDEARRAFRRLEEGEPKAIATWKRFSDQNRAESWVGGSSIWTSCPATRPNSSL